MIDKVKKIINNNIMFFVDNAYSEEYKVFYSEINEYGEVISDKVHIISLSRLIFGLVESSKVLDDKKDFLEERTTECVDFIKTHFIGNDKYGKYFIPTVCVDGSVTENRGLNIWEQSYGFNGLVSYFDEFNDKDILDLIRELFDAYVKRFYDNEAGGFVFDYSFRNDKDYDTKRLQTIMYPVTSFLGRLYLADEENQNVYKPYLVEAYELAMKNVYNFDSHNVQVTFNRKFKYLRDKEVLPGHYFQVAWFFMMSRKFDALSNNEKLYQYGVDVFNHTLNKNWMKNAEEFGFPESVNPATSMAVSDRRIWWEHAEWINALCHLKEDVSEEIGKVLNYFESTFVDYRNGCEYFATDTKKVPYSDLKSNLGKSSYHTIEMCMFVLNKIKCN